MRYAPALSRAIGILVLGPLSWKVISRGLHPMPGGFLLTIVDGANLIFHEAGHVLFFFLGDFLQFLGGSLTQVAIPVICASYFRMHRQQAAYTVTLFWTGESLTNVAAYIADARRMQLPLIGGDHDWNYLLGRLHLLHQADSIGRFVFLVGVLSVLLSLFLLTTDLVRAWEQASNAE